MFFMYGIVSQKSGTRERTLEIPAQPYGYRSGSGSPVGDVASRQFQAKLVR